MIRKHLHIIAFDIPYPADYGGVIDVFYQIRALYRAGISIHLHCFQYGGRMPHRELEKYCVSVRYYRRRVGLFSFMSKNPYIIQSRRSKKLEKSLLRNHFPILCEGIHSCGIVLNPKFTKRNIILRAANVEHDYYASLAEKESNPFKRFYYKSEAKKLNSWEKNLPFVRSVVAISDNDFEYFSKTFPNKIVIRAYGFNALDDIESMEGKGKFALFHANLSVAENIEAAVFLIEKVAPWTDYPFVIAGKSPSKEIMEKADNQKNVKIIANPSEFKMQNLIREAHIQLMLTFQSTGFKLKLITSLFAGRFVIANDGMMQGNGLKKCILCANTPEEFMSMIHMLKDKAFDSSEIQRRKTCISEDYFNQKKAKDIINLLK